MKRLFTIAVLTTFIWVVPVARADCYYNGSAYPTGTKLGSLTCMADGSWRKG